MDRDADTVPDARDACPDEPEDLDGFVDADGCVDRDNDGDGVPDAHEFKAGRWTTCDACPDRATRSSNDRDGCPELSPFFCDGVSLGRIAYARTGTLTAAELEPLSDIARVMQEKPHLRVFVDAHVDRQRDAKAAKRITEQPAALALDALVERGVARDRLEPRSMGQEMPRADDRTAEGRASNRRIDFQVRDPESFYWPTELVCR